MNRAEARMHLRLDGLDDLWALRTLLAEGDHVAADTFRTAETTGDKVREGKAEKRPMRLTVQAKEVSWHEFDDHLRVLGPITHGPQDMGKHHTLTFHGTGEEVVIHKTGGIQNWHQRILDAAVKATQKPQVLLLAVDDSEAQFALLKSYGLQFLGTLSATGQGKRYAGASEAKKKFYEETLRSLKLFRVPPDLPCIVVGPGWWREEFMTFVAERDPGLAKGLVTDGTSQGGRVGLQEALRRGVLHQVAIDSRVAMETMAVDDLFERVAKDKPVAFGRDETQRAVQAGAADLVLVTDVQARSGAVDQLLLQAEHARATFHILSTRHEAGQRLERLGGAAASLRFALEAT